MGNDAENRGTEVVGEYPQKDAKSIGYDIAEGAVGSIPGFGAALQKLVQSLGFDPIKRREQEFVERLGRIVTELQQRQDIDVDALRDNVYFEGLINDLFDKFKRARSEAKKELLMNAAANAAAGLSIDEALAGRFLSLVEQFSPNHVLMLKLLQDPSANPLVQKRMENLGMGALTHILAAAFPLTSSTTPVIFQDLAREGFVEGGLNVTMTGQGLVQKRTTATGDAFLRFVLPR